MPLGERFPTFLPNVVKHSRNYPVSDPRRSGSSATPLWESQIFYSSMLIYSSFWGFNSGLIEGCSHRRNLTNKTEGQNRPWLLGTLIDEGINLQRGGTLVWTSPYYTRAVHKETELFNLLLYLKLNQTCLLQSTPLHSWYTAPNVIFSSGTRPGTCFAGWREGSLIEFSSISSTVWNRRPFSEDFNFGNKKKSAGAKSGE